MLLDIEIVVFIVGTKISMLLAIEIVQLSKIYIFLGIESVV
jgi:hypothetical protein